MTHDETPRGMADVRDAVIADLRDHQPLQDYLPERQAVYDAWPNEATEYGIQLAVAVVWHGSSHKGATTRRVARVQCSVVSTAEWREGRPDPKADMMEVLDHAADRFEVACDIPGAWPVGSGGAGGEFLMNDIGGGRRAFIGDWRIAYQDAR